MESEEVGEKKGIKNEHKVNKSTRKYEKGKENARLRNERQ